LRASLVLLSSGLQQLSVAEALLRGVGDGAAADSLQAKAAEYSDFGAAVALRLSLAPAAAPPQGPSPPRPQSSPPLFQPPLPPPHPAPLGALGWGPLAPLRRALAAFEAAPRATGGVLGPLVDEERGRLLLGEVSRKEI